LIDFGDNITLQVIDFDHVYDFGLIQSKIIVIRPRRFAIAAIAKKPHFTPMIHLDGRGAVFF
jgi:hypothetical protein